MQFNLKISFMNTSTLNFINLAFMFYFSIYVCVYKIILTMESHQYLTIHQPNYYFKGIQGNIILILAWELTKKTLMTYLRFIMHWIMNFFSNQTTNKKGLVTKTKVFLGKKMAICHHNIRNLNLPYLNNRL